MIAKIDSEKHLNQLKRGAKALVADFLNPKIATKLMAMGIMPGSNIQVIRKAPFGGGFYVKVDNLLIALRKNEAGSILVK